MTFRKDRPAAPPGFFEVEAAGLAWLTASGAVRTPRVQSVGPGFIELEQLRTCSPTRAAAQEFGRSLAALHDAGAPAFGCGPSGWNADGFIGDAPLPFGTYERWGVAYAALRIQPYLDHVGGADRRVFEHLCARLDDGDFDDAAPPARLHGDLWSGNVLFTPDGVALIDPAAQGGHRISDLAMLALFGCPHLDAIHGAYAEASEHLPRDWELLIPLHQVHPLLVHTVLFGGSYARQAVRAATDALAVRR